jgi:hypothetical protein
VGFSLWLGRIANVRYSGKTASAVNAQPGTTSHQVSAGENLRIVRLPKLRMGSRAPKKLIPIGRQDKWISWISPMGKNN